MTKRVFTIDELAELLNTTTTAIRSNMQRYNYKAIPVPIKLGRRVVWPVSRVNSFLEEREKESEIIFARPSMPTKRRGRPSKKEQVESR